MILGILQARFSSTRLPGKVLRPILGKPMLELQLERVQRIRAIDRIVVATSTDTADDQIEALCHTLGIACFRGSPDDVLDRFYQAALPYKPDHVVRLTGDCPLTDPILIDQIIHFYRDGNFDYASNIITPTFPDGLDAEIFRFSALEQAWREAKLLSQREHVTPFIHQQSAHFRLGSFQQASDLSALRWTVDEPEDFDFVSLIYQELYPVNPNFGTEDILKLLEQHPELNTINTQFERNEGYRKSLLKDKKSKD